MRYPYPESEPAGRPARLTEFPSTPALPGHRDRGGSVTGLAVPREEKDSPGISFADLRAEDDITKQSGYETGR